MRLVVPHLNYILCFVNEVIFLIYIPFFCTKNKEIDRVNKIYDEDERITYLSVNFNDLILIEYFSIYILNQICSFFYFNCLILNVPNVIKNEN